MRSLILPLLLALSGDPFLDGAGNMEATVIEREQRREAWSSRFVTGRVVGADGTDVKTYWLGSELYSWKHQDARSFLQEQGDAMRQITEQTGWEVCSRVCLSRDGRLGLKIQTLKAALSCHAGNEPDDCPQGMIPTPVVVHTHGAGSIVEATPVDIVLGHEDPFAWIEDANLPSPEDIKAGPGWLLAPNGQTLSYGQHPEWMRD